LNNVIARPIGLIGLEHYSSREWLSAFKNSDCWDLVACSDCNIMNHEKSKELFPEIGCYEDHREMIERELLTSVLVLAPPREKPLIIKDCAESGLAILCLPPISGNLNDGSEIIQRCVDESILLHVAFRLNNHPALKEMLKLVGEDKNEIVRKIRLEYKSLYWESELEEGNAYFLEAGSNALNLVSGFISVQNYELIGQVLTNRETGPNSIIMNVQSQDNRQIEIVLFPIAGSNDSNMESLSMTISSDNNVFKCDSEYRTLIKNAEAILEESTEPDWNQNLYEDVLNTFSFLPLLPGPSPSGVSALQALDKLLSIQSI